MEDKENKAMELRALEADANMRKAAEYGQQLISQISDLKKSKEHADQNIYELKNRLDACSVLEKAAAEDVEALKDANTKLMNDKEIAELQCAVKISKLLEEQKVKELIGSVRHSSAAMLTESSHVMSAIPCLRRMKNSDNTSGRNIRECSATPCIWMR